MRWHIRIGGPAVVAWLVLSGCGDGPTPPGEEETLPADGPLPIQLVTDRAAYLPGSRARVEIRNESDTTVMMGDCGGVLERQTGPYQWRAVPASPSPCPAVGVLLRPGDVRIHFFDLAGVTAGGLYRLRYSFAPFPGGLEGKFYRRSHPFEVRSEPTAGPEALELRVNLNRMVFAPEDTLIAEVRARNPGVLPVVAGVTCINYGPGLELQGPSASPERVFTGIPPCKVPNLPPTVRIEPGASWGIGFGTTAFFRGREPGVYRIMVVFRTVQRTYSGQVVEVTVGPP